jgi:hypothetical protein
LTSVSVRVVSISGRKVLGPYVQRETQATFFEAAGFGDLAILCANSYLIETIDSTQKRADILRRRRYEEALGATLPTSCASSKAKYDSRLQSSRGFKPRGPRTAYLNASSCSRRIPRQRRTGKTR